MIKRSFKRTDAILDPSASEMNGRFRTLRFK